MMAKFAIVDYKRHIIKGANGLTARDVLLDDVFHRDQRLIHVGHGHPWPPPRAPRHRVAAEPERRGWQWTRSAPGWPRSSRARSGGSSPQASVPTQSAPHCRRSRRPAPAGSRFPWAQGNCGTRQYAPVHRTLRPAGPRFRFDFCPGRRAPFHFQRMRIANEPLGRSRLLLSAVVPTTNTPSTEPI